MDFLLHEGSVPLILTLVKSQLYLKYLTEKKILHSISIYRNSDKLKNLVCTMGNTNIYHVLPKCKKKEGRHTKWKAWKTIAIIQCAKRT